MVMLCSKQQQKINKITHLDMPVNLIILEQGEVLGIRTKALRLVVGGKAKTRAAMVSGHDFSPFPSVTDRICGPGSTSDQLSLV